MQIDTLAFIAVALVAVAAAVLSIVGWLRAGPSSSVPALMEGKIDSELRHTREQSQLVVNVLDRRLVEMAGKVGDLERGLANFRMSTVKELNSVRVAQERGHAAMQTAIGNTLRGVQDSVSQQLVAIRDDNNRSLEQIRSTVDEKLQKTLNDRINDSFRLVNEQLDSVSKGLGEMRGMAQSVGDLRKVLSNVKTRGIVGEVQLAAWQPSQTVSTVWNLQSGFPARVTSSCTCQSMQSFPQRPTDIWRMPRTQGMTWPFAQRGRSWRPA